MAPVNITLPDGSVKQLPEGSTGYDLAASIGTGLAKAAVAIVMTNKQFESVIKDFHYTLQDGDEIRILTKKDTDSLDVLRHTTSHVMAQAVQNLYPQAKVAIGPTVENGFYYDFDIPNHKLSPEDFDKIEAEMHRLANQGQKMQQRKASDVDSLLTELKTNGEKFKAEILDKYRNDPTLYYFVNKDSDEDIWFDVCEGPHLTDTSPVKVFKLMSVAGAYWRGDEKNEQLQRVYATAFWNQKDLDAYLEQLSEADKRDHRKLAKELDLFSIKDEIGPGLILWHPNLSVVREQLEAYLRKRLRRGGYQSVYTPHLAKQDLWDISGHTSHYLENMFTMEIEDQPYILKPMNCPMHTMIFKSQLHSYRDLPIRIGELGTVYRYEKSGVMHGLNRVRGFTQDDAHVFCRQDQIKDEIMTLIKFVDETFKLFDMDFSQVELSTRPEKYVGELENWDKAEVALKEALDDYGLPYEINEGDGAFYGPKIDFKIKDAIGRTWQCSTIQLDFNLPHRFELKFKDNSGQDQQPIMIHRAIFGSLERFAGILIEHYAGAFPTWLAPTQAIILPISDRHVDFCNQLKETMMDQEIRVTIDDSNETVNNKIRKAELDKIPYMLVVGDREIEDNALAVRSKANGKLGVIAVDEFLDGLHKEVISYGKAVIKAPVAV